MTRSAADEMNERCGWIGSLVGGDSSTEQPLGFRVRRAKPFESFFAPPWEVWASR